MKNLKFCMLLMLFCPPMALVAQNKLDTAAINSIKTEVANINHHISSYKKITRDDMGQSTEGGEATAYFENNDLKAITDAIYGETFKAIDEYYFYKNKLIFYHEIAYRYYTSIWINSHVKVDSTIETRYYFNGNAIIKYLHNPQKVLTVKALDKEAKETLTEAARLIKLIDSKEED